MQSLAGIEGVMVFDGLWMDGWSEEAARGRLAIETNRLFGDQQAFLEEQGDSAAVAAVAAVEPRAQT